MVTDLSQIACIDIGYNSRMVYGICFFLLFCNLLGNLDHGALPAALTDVKKDLKFRNVEMGSLGSYVYLGFVVGSLASTGMNDVFSYKMILCLSLIGNGVGAMLFIVSYSYYVVSFARFLSGFGQILLIIYNPLFIDMFLTSEKERGFWLSLVVIGGPIGTSVGYVGTGVITSNGGKWWYFFNFIALTCAVCLIVVILTPSSYLNLDQVLRVKRKE